MAPLRETDILMFVVDARNGITQTDFAIRDWIKKNVISRSDLTPNNTTKDLVREEGTGSLTDKIYVDKVLLVANKCDDGQTFDSENDLYQLGLGEPIFVAVESGEGMHELWKIIDEAVPVESIEWFKKRAKKRFARYKALRD